MDIAIQFEELEKMTFEKEIFMIEGDINVERAVIVDLPNIDTNSIIIYLNLIEKLGAKIIVYESLVLDSDTFKLFNDEIKELADLELNKKIKSLEYLENKLLGYTLFVFKEGILFRFQNYIENFDDFLEIQNAALGNLRAKRTENSRFKTLSRSKIDEFGKLLAEHQDFISLKKRSQRELLASEMFELQFKELDVNPNYTANLIALSAETYLETKIKPLKDKELKSKITELINTGMTKIQIAAKLGISKDTVNKFI